MSFGLSNYSSQNQKSERVETTWQKRSDEHKPFGLRSNVKRGTKPAHQPFSLLPPASDEERIETSWSKKSRS